MNKLEDGLSLLSVAVINTKTKRHVRREGFVFVLQFQFITEVHRGGNRLEAGTKVESWRSTASCLAFLG